MSDTRTEGARGGDRAPGDHHPAESDAASRAVTYVVGFGLAAILTVASFYVASGSSFVWGPSVPFALVALAIAQMGVHLVFFFHLTSAPDNTNNVLALAFGVLVVFLVIAGSLWIMTNLDQGMMPHAGGMAAPR